MRLPDSVAKKAQLRKTSTTRSTSVLNWESLPKYNEFAYEEPFREAHLGPSDHNWSPTVKSMMGLKPPDPEFTALKHRLKQSRDNIRQCRNDFFNSPVSTRTPTPTELCRLEKHRDTLWQQSPPYLIDRLSVPSICVTSNGASPMSNSDREDDLDMCSSSSLSLKYFSEDEIDFQKSQSETPYAGTTVMRSQSFQEQGSFKNDEQTMGRFQIKRVISDDITSINYSGINSLYPCHSHRPTHLSEMPLSRDHNSQLRIKPHVVSRLLTKMRRITEDWRQANKSRRGDLIFV